MCKVARGDGLEQIGWCKRAACGLVHLSVPRSRIGVRLPHASFERDAMGEIEFAKTSRVGHYVMIALAGMSLAFSAVAWHDGETPRWTSIALPLVLIANSIAGLEVGPFRDPVIGKRYEYLRMVATIAIGAAALYHLLARAR